MTSVSQRLHNQAVAVPPLFLFEQLLVRVGGTTTRRLRGRGASRPLTATLLRRGPRPPKGTRLLRISAKGVHGGTVIFTVSVQLGVPVAHIGLD